jgi:hypothetical protein
MPDVAHLIRDHVTPEVECVDRLYRNGLCEPLLLSCVGSHAS